MAGPLCKERDPEEPPGDKKREEVAGWVNGKSKKRIRCGCTYGQKQRRSRVGSREGTD